MARDGGDGLDRRLVYVDMRRADYTVNACWLNAGDVKRR
jgi:hypothetical protein